MAESFDIRAVKDEPHLVSLTQYHMRTINKVIGLLQAYEDHSGKGTAARARASPYRIPNLIVKTEVESQTAQSWKDNVAERLSGDQESTEIFQCVVQKAEESKPEEDLYEIVLRSSNP